MIPPFCCLSIWVSLLFYIRPVLGRVITAVLLPNWTLLAQTITNLKKRKTFVSVLSIDNQLMMKKKDDDKHAWVFILYENQLITWVQWKTKQKKQNKLVDHLCWGFSFFRSISCYKVYTRPIHFYFLVDTHENNEIDLMTSTLFYYRESKGEGSRKIYPNSPGVKHFFSPLYLIKV